MREALETARAGAERVGREFTGPDDDWAPILVVRDRDGGLTVALITDAFSDDESKADFFEVYMPALLGQLEATEAALVTSAWSAPARPGDLTDERDYADESKRPSLRSDREEVLVISWASSNGEQEALMAKIERHPDRPPTLDWSYLESKLPDGSKPTGAFFSGRVLDALKQGVR